MKRKIFYKTSVCLIVMLSFALQAGAQDFSESADFSDTHDGATSMLHGNIAFSLKKLQDLASQLPENCLTEHDTILICPEISANKSLVIEYNDKKQVSHLGISMFSKEIKQLINEPICNF
ncbi:MAG: hypothetical protein LBE56_08510, partial [Tannerella sp.]|nr:hypothetical protein [Tannerella sp.]